MVGRVALTRTTPIVALIAGVVGGEAAKTVAGEKVAGASVHHRALLLRGQRALGQRDGKQLVWPQRGVVPVGAVDHVKTAAPGLIPEALESRARPACERFVFVGGLSKRPRKLAHSDERVVPEGIDLDRLADAGRDHPVAHLGVHPGELRASLARIKKAVGWVNVDVVARATRVPGNNVSQDR